MPGCDKTVAGHFSVLRILIRLAGTGEASNVIGVLCEVNKQRFSQSPRPFAVTYQRRNWLSGFREIRCRKRFQEVEQAFGRPGNRHSLVKSVRGSNTSCRCVLAAFG